MITLGVTMLAMADSNHRHGERSVTPLTMPIGYCVVMTS